jgi:DNA primase
MDCISVFLRGNSERDRDQRNGLYRAAGGDSEAAHVERVVNFDPDAAGANAAEKSIALLTEEGFTIKIVTLDGGSTRPVHSRAGRGGLTRKRCAGRGGRPIT